MDREQLYLIGEALFATIVLLSLLFYIRNVGNNSQFEQNFMARDLGLLIDTMQAAPGDVSTSYTTTIQQKQVLAIEGIPEMTFVVGIEPSYVYVYPNQTSFENPRTYYFGKDSSIFVAKSDKVSGIFNLKKEGKEFIIQQKVAK